MLDTLEKTRVRGHSICNRKQLVRREESCRGQSGIQGKVRNLWSSHSQSGKGQRSQTPFSTREIDNQSSASVFCSLPDTEKSM